MNAYRPSKNIPWRAVATAVLGACFCLYASSSQGKLLCLTSGCILNRDFSLFGISLWHLGCGAFLLYILVALVGGDRPARPFACLFLGADCLFLILMGLTLPCVPCLGAACFFALLFTTSTPAVFPRKRSLLLGFWMVLFLFNGFFLARNALAPTPLFGTPNAPVKLYFSPSCPACHEAVRRYSTLAQQGKAALYPVAEQESDVPVIAAMEQLAREGISPFETLERAISRPFVPRFGLSTILLHWRLRANHASVLALGDGRVPLIIQEGLDLTVRSAEQNEPSQAHLLPNGGDDLFDLSLSACGGNQNDKDCPQTMQP